MPTALDTRQLVNLLAALLIGALVGIEREKNKAASGNVGIGGVRTFILFSLTGAFGALVAQALGSPLVLASAVTGVVALTCVGYVVQARSKPEAVGLTTETAALTVCLLGAACTAGYPELALAGGIAVSAFLAYKQSLHGLVAKLGPDDISAGVKLLAASFIVLPLLPKQPIDPWGALVPRSLWLLVILIAALSLVGYVATRALGSERGTAITGLSGGLVSSTAVTLTFAKRSREEHGATDDALAAGTFLAWGVSFARVIVLAAIIHAPLATQMLVPFGAMALVTVATALWLLRRSQAAAAAGTPAPVSLRNPFSLVSAIQFGLLFAGVLLVMTIAQQRFPSGGTYVVAALAGTSDVDAITLSMATLARSGQASLGTAALSILIAVLSNTVVKCGISAGLGGPRLRRSALLLTALLVAIGIAAFIAL
ncbi:MAG TPA: MgtC/SapB family protein [Vicinamibacteria bacterium]